MELPKGVVILDSLGDLNAENAELIRRRERREKKAQRNDFLSLRPLRFSYLQ